MSGRNYVENLKMCFFSYVDFNLTVIGVNSQKNVFTLQYTTYQQYRLLLIFMFDVFIYSAL